MKKVAIIGSLSEGEGSLNGQTVKTKVLIEELCLEYGAEQLYLINTSGKLSKILVFIRIIVALFYCSNIIILPAENGLCYIAPYLSFFNLFWGRSLHYDVIGGWLPEFIKNKPSLVKCLKRFSAIYVETKSMKIALEEQGFDNVMVIPNCKKLNIVDNPSFNNDMPNEKITFATFSRIMKDKGIEDAVIAIHKANNSKGSNVFHLDVYGFVEPNEYEWFNSLQELYRTEMTYKGSVSFEQSTEVLKKYYGLLFPTYYSGEGFAGSLIDAYAAGLPVIASDWRYNSEIVEDGKDGIIVPIQDTDKLSEAILWSQSNYTEWCQFRKNVIRKAHAYSPSEALVVLKENLV